MSESCENYLIVIFSEEVDTKVEDDVLSSQNDFSEKGLLDLLAAAVKIRGEIAPETEDGISDVSKNNFFQTTQSETREVSTEQTLVQPEDVASVGKSVASETNVCNSINCDSILKKEAFIEDEGKVHQLLMEHSYADSFRCYDDDADIEDNRSFQTTLVRKEFNEKCGNELGSLVKDSPEESLYYVGLQRPSNHDGSKGARLSDVSVVPKDLLSRSKVDPQKPVQRHVNSNWCQSTTKCKPQSKLKNSDEKNVDRKSSESRKHLRDSDRGKLVVSGKHCGKWNSCTLCPARFRFMHSLKRHSTVDHDVHLCSECLSTFQYRSDLQTHLKTHPARKQYFCVFCSFRCQVEAELKVHSRIHSNEKFFSCAQCYVEFDKSQALLDHILEHTNRESFLCLRCPARFDDASSLIQHLNVHSNDKLVFNNNLTTLEHKSLLDNDVRSRAPFPSKCHIATQPITPSLLNDCCDAELRESSEVERHLRPPTGEQPSARQDVAAFETEGEAKLVLSCADGVAGGDRMQLPSHSNGKPFSDMLSPTTFNIKLGFEPQSITYSNDKSFSCSKCDAKFKSKHRLKLHLTNSHSDKSPYSCKMCTAIFKLKPNFLVHSSEGPFFCAYCGVKFKHKSRHKCIYCHKFYSTYSSLSKHQQFFCAASENICAKKRLRCNFCEKTFPYSETFKMHIHTHTLPYKCQLCGKAFSRQWLLNGHIRTHTGEKPYFCVFCDRAFSDRSNLRAHLLTHSKAKKYSCLVCNRTFSKILHLFNHTDKECSGSTPG